MTVVVRLRPAPCWWVWRPGADRGPATRLAARRTGRARSRALAAVAVPTACAAALLAPELWSAALLASAPLLFAGGALLLRRVPERAAVRAASPRDVVHCEQFADAVQQRRAQRLCEDFHVVRKGADPARLPHVELLLWQALVALRDSQEVRETLARTTNRPGRAAAVAEPARALADLDRRVDRFAAALRIAGEEQDPRLAASALRRAAALGPI
ncbi:hypothetical protein GCM10009660_32490 [Catellatospora bangladeshensis]